MPFSDEIYEVSKDQAKKAKAHEREGIVVAVGHSDILVQPKGSTRNILCEKHPDAEVGDRCTILWIPGSKRRIISHIFKRPKTLNPPKFNRILNQDNGDPNAFEFAQMIRSTIAAALVDGDITSIYDADARTITLSIGSIGVGDIIGFAEAVQDIVGTEIVDGSRINVTYDDTAGTVTIDFTGMALDDLSDVDAPTPADGDILTWVDADNAWENVPAPVGFENPMTDAGDMIYESGAAASIENTDRSGVENIGSGSTETIIGDCDLTLGVDGNMVVTYNIWTSSYWPGHTVTISTRLRRTNLSGAVLASDLNYSYLTDSTAGHERQFTGVFTDTSPTDGHYVLTFERPIGSVSIYSDTRELTLENSATISPTRLPIGIEDSILRVSDALLPVWSSFTEVSSEIVDLILTDDDGEILTDDDGVVLLGDL